jgi:hypothetical protein
MHLREIGVVTGNLTRLGAALIATKVYEMTLHTAYLACVQLVLRPAEIGCSTQACLPANISEH